MPEIASDGIQVIDVTDFSIRMWSPSLPAVVVAGKAKPTRRPGLVGPVGVQSLAEMRPRRNTDAPATAATTTAIRDLFGFPPSTDGVAPRAFFLPTRFATFQTAQPMTALRLLTMLMGIAYPHRRRPNQTRKSPGPAGGRGPGWDEGTSRLARSRSAEKLATRSARRSAATSGSPRAALAGSGRSSRTSRSCAGVHVAAGALARRVSHRGRARSPALHGGSAPQAPLTYKMQIGGVSCWSAGFISAAEGAGAAER